MIARLMVAGALVACAALSACSTPSTSKGMTPQEVAVPNRSVEPVSILVVGGKETNSVMLSQIGNAEFRDALKQSILEAGLFPQVVEGKGGGYYLEAYIGELSQPMLGFTITVDLEVSYRLVDLKSNSKVWQKSIRTSHTATTSDSMVFETRTRLANEAAARKNIEAAITAMGALQLR